MKAIYWVVGVSVIAMGVFITLFLGDTQKTLPKIRLSYFTDEREIAESVTKILSQDLLKQSAFWVGVEPEKNEQLEVALQLKHQLEKEKPFRMVIIDQELNLKQEWLEKFGAIETLVLKESIKPLSELLAELEKRGDRYFLLTAAIYSTPLIHDNQIHQMKTLKAIQPMTFSFGYFPIFADQEANMLFPCNTDDHTGTSDWGCAVANKSRFMRRRVEKENPKPWIGAMDLIGEKDYMLLLYKKEGYGK